MRGPSREEKRDALSSFIVDDVPDVVVLDRSTLERYAICPMQAHLIEQGHGKPMPEVVETGELVHQAFGQAIREWIDAPGMGPSGVRQALESALRSTRPDLSPEVWRAARPAVWEFAAFLAEINPANILHFDGGEEINRSGQLAMDLAGGVRFTSEVDLLWSQGKQIAAEEDWKSGHGTWTRQQVADAFQFQSHAALVFENYPDLQVHEVRVWNTRHGTRTWPVTFERRDLQRYKSRIHAAVAAWYEHHEEPIALPTLEKCEACPVAAYCEHSGDIGDVAKDPAAALRSYVALAAKEKAAAKLLTTYTDNHGPIQPDGFAFGRVATSKPTAKVYPIKEKPDESANTN